MLGHIKIVFVTAFLLMKNMLSHGHEKVIVQYTIGHLELLCGAASTDCTGEIPPSADAAAATSDMMAAKATAASASGESVKLLLAVGWVRTAGREAVVRGPCVGVRARIH